MRRSSITAAKKIVFGLLNTLAGATQDAFVLGTGYSFIAGKNEEDTLQSTSWAIFAALLLSEIPLTITVIEHWFNPANKGHDDHAHSHGCDHSNQTKYLEKAEVAAIILSFGPLAFGGTNHFLSTINGCPPSARYTMSIIAFFVSAWGNYQLHSDHTHAEAGVCTLFKKVSAQGYGKAAFAIYLLQGITFGHLLQGFLAADLLLRSLGVDDGDTILRPIIGFFMAMIVTVFEGITEGVSSFTHLLNDNKHSIPYTSKIVAGIPSIVHGSYAFVGALQLSRFIYTLATNKELAKDLPLWSRLLILIASVIVFGLPNTCGQYFTTLSATHKALENLNFCGLFVTPQHDEVEERLMSSLDEKNTGVNNLVINLGEDTNSQSNCQCCVSM